MTRRPAPRGRARRRPLPILAFVVAALAAFLMPAVRPDPVDAQATLNSQATLTVLSAPVEVQRASGNRDVAASGATLVVGDRVFTGAGGTAKLTFFQGTEVDIAPDTELMVQEMTQRVSGASTVSFGQAVGSTVAMYSLAQTTPRSSPGRVAESACPRLSRSNMRRCTGVSRS